MKVKINNNKVFLDMDYTHVLSCNEKLIEILEDDGSVNIEVQHGCFYYNFKTVKSKLKASFSTLKFIWFNK